MKKFQSIPRVVQTGAGAGVVMLAATPPAYSGAAGIEALSIAFVCIALASSLCLCIAGEGKRAFLGLVLIVGLSVLVIPKTD